MKNSISRLMLLACTAAMLWSCSKKIDLVAPVTAPTGFAFIKIAQYSPNFRNVVGGRDSFNIYINGNKLNGGFFTYGSLFPTATNLYAAVPVVTTGSQLIRLTVNGVNTPDSISLFGFNKTLLAGNYYSFYLTDSLISLDPSKQLFVQDNFAVTDTLHYTIRFVHAITNDSLGKNVDVWSTRLASYIFTNVSPGSASSFISEPYNLLSDTLIIRRSGNPFELCRLNTAILARQRAYTLVYKGLPNTSAGTKGRSLAVFADQ